MIFGVIQTYAKLSTSLLYIKELIKLQVDVNNDKTFHIFDSGIGL